MKTSKKLFCLVSMGIASYYILHSVGIYFDFFPVNLRLPLDILRRYNITLIVTLRRYDIDLLFFAIVLYGGLAYTIGYLCDKLKSRRIKIEKSEIKKL